MMKRRVSQPLFTGHALLLPHSQARHLRAGYHALSAITLAQKRCAFATFQAPRNREPQRRQLSSLAAELSARHTFQIARDVEQIRSLRRDAWKRDRTVGFVPTMGALHGGHLQLAREAALENDEVYVSLYVNPTQFGVNEDLDAYPRTWNTDMQKLEKLNAELKRRNQKGKITAVFAPTTQEMYPNLPPSSEIDGKGSFVTITPLASLLEGASRPVFFRGVATVCMKLFNIILPDRVYFGQKDVQQTIVIRRLVQDFHLDINVRVVRTERESDGLAMSSRNVYLGSRRRKLAPILHEALKIAASQVIEQGILTREEILGPAISYLEQELADQIELSPESRVLFEVDYLSLADPTTMEEVAAVAEASGAILSGAMKMLPIEDLQEGEDEGEGGGARRPVRLIDNIVLPGKKG